MSVLVVDAMNDAAKWSAVSPDGVTPSNELTVADDEVTFAAGADRVSTRVTAGDGAVGHSIRRTTDAVDLTDFTELRLSIRLPRPRASGRFLFELRLGSAALPIGDGANRWHRLITADSAKRWEAVHFTIDDLPEKIATALTQIQIRCLQPSFEANLDDIVAARPQMLLDCDRAVVAALGKITVGDAAVPVAVTPGDAAAPVAPGLNIRQVDAHYAPHRVVDAPARRDYTAEGFREVLAGTPYDVDYAVTPVADSRADQAALLEAVLTTLPPDGELVVDGEYLPIRLLSPAGPDRPGGAATEVPVLLYRIGARCPAVVKPPVREVQRIDIGTEVMVTA
ncbi:MAG: hypothetical protein JST91_05520 [Actinobacteria bacterium]|nr:hypothetical protein [Actinomycetota bacterium]